MFDIFGKSVAQFYLLDPQSNSNISISECNFWGNGVAILTTDMTIFVAEGLSSPDISSSRPHIYSLRPGLWTGRSSTAMGIIPPTISKSGNLEVLVGTSDCSILVIEEDGRIEDQETQHSIGSPIIKISVSQNGKFVACYRRDGILSIMDSSFKNLLLDFDTKSLSRPIEIAWCGEDAICLQWRNTGIVMVGPFGDWLNFPYDEAVHLVTEPDCCRIITSRGCQILQRVPNSSVGIRSLGSTEPAALLMDAMEAFEEGDPKSDENIRSIANSHQLIDAISACINAASAEFDVKKQESLMKAASYGKAFCSESDHSSSPSIQQQQHDALVTITKDFVDTANKLRILNDVRKPSVGLPITILQYNRLTPEVLVGRLTARNQHFLAIRVCELLGLKTDQVLVRWACEKVKKMATAGTTNAGAGASFSSVNSSISSVSANGIGFTDDEINRTVKNQLEQFAGPNCCISYLAIAEAAYSVHRIRLATFILDNNSMGANGVTGTGNSAADQIPLLLKMNEDELALQKAINSEDTNLIYYTLISLEARMALSSSNSNQNLNTFYKIVHTHLEAANLLKIYYRNKVNMSDRSMLHNLLLYNKNYFEAGLAAASQALIQNLPAIRQKTLEEASKLFAQGKEKDTGFYKTMTDEQIELMIIQDGIKRRCDTKDFTDLSLTRTIYELVALSIENSTLMWPETEITKIMKRFKVSEKSLWYMKIHCMSSMGEWILLNKFANEKKSPVGYKPFAAACIKYSRSQNETEKYVEKVSDPEEKFDLYIELKLWRKAMEVATKLRDPYRLQNVARLCPELERQIQETISKL